MLHLFFQLDENTPEKALIIDHRFSYKQDLTQVINVKSGLNLFVPHTKSTKKGNQSTIFVLAIASLEYLII